MRLDEAQARMVREGLDVLKERVEEGLELSEAIVLTDAVKVAGELETEAGPFFLTLTVDAELVADPQEPDEENLEGGETS